VWIYTNSTNRQEDYRALAALVERHAAGGPVGIIGGRFFSIDFYLGRALTSVRTESALAEWLARPDRPVLVATAKAWQPIKEDGAVRTEVLDSMLVRSHEMFIVRRAGATASR